jgi:hypothetical protein
VNLIGRTETLVNKGSITSGRCAGKPARAAVLSSVNLIGTVLQIISKHFCLQNLPINIPDGATVRIPIKIF